MLAILVFSQLSSLIVETGSLKNFLLWEEPNSAYDNWISHVAEGIASNNYNLYAPYDKQTNGFGNFQVPTTDDLSNWETITDAFLMHEWDTAQSLIEQFGYPYQVVQFNDTDSGRTYFMMREVPNDQYFDDNGTIDPYDDEWGAFHFGWGLYIYNPESTRPIIITVPHPGDDYPTPAIGYETFQLWNARFLLIAGAGREVRWTNIPPYTNAKSLSDPTRVANHPFNKSYQLFADQIRSIHNMREFSVQIHTYDWNRHVGYSSVQISAGNGRTCPNLPIRDLSNLKHDLINQGSHLMIPANTYGTHEDVYLNDYYAVYYNVHDFTFEDGENSYAVNNSISLPGAEGNQPMLYTLSGWNDYDSYDPFFHVEMDELPNSYDETVNNHKWFYGWTEMERRWDYSNLFGNFIRYYSRWWQDLDSVLDEMFVMNDGTNPTDPSNLVVHSQSLNHITLRWNRSFAYDFDSYEILYGTQPIDLGGYQTFSRANNNLLASQACEQINVTGLTNSNLYYFKIRALDKNGNYSVLSNEVMTRPAPANVTSMTAYGMDNTVRVYWQVSGQTNNLGFSVYRKVGDGDYQLRDSYLTNPALVNATANSFEWWDTLVSNETYYTYMISATNTENMEFMHNFPSSCSPRTIHSIFIKNSSESLVDSITFSNNPYASDGQDTYYDVSKPTPSGNTYVWNAFWQQYWGSSGTHLAREIKGAFNPDSQLKTWVMRVRSDQIGVSLKIEASDTFTRAEKLYLYDSGAGAWHDLLSGPYYFTVANANTRTMTLYWGNMQPTVTHGVQPNRIYQGATSASFYWSTQYNFLVDHFDISIQNETDSLWVSSNMPFDATSYTFNLPNDVDMPGCKFVVDAYAIDGVHSRFYSPFTFGMVPAMTLLFNEGGWLMRSNVINSGTYTVAGVYGNAAEAFVLDYEGNWMSQTPYDFGTGYWVNNPESAFFSSNLSVQRDSLSFAIYNGWNLIANPHVCSYKVKDLLFWINGLRYKFGELFSQELVSSGVYVYRNGKYELTHQIEAHESFLLKYYGSNQNQALITFVPYYDGPAINTQIPLWQLDVSATQDTYDADGLIIGANVLSTDNYDFRFDQPEPIEKPFSSVRMYLDRSAESDSTFMEQKLHREFREIWSGAAEETKIWDFKVEVPSSSPIDFSFDQSLVPENYTITFVIEGSGHHLYNGNNFTWTPPTEGTYTGQIIVRNYPLGVSDNVIPALSGLKIYPNPFNPLTNIAFYMGKEDKISLDIYNIRGQKVHSLYNGRLKAGQHSLQWDGKDDNKRGVATGIYFVRIQTPAKTHVMKMMLLK